MFEEEMVGSEQHYTGPVGKAVQGMPPALPSLTSTSFRTTQDGNESKLKHSFKYFIGFRIKAPVLEHRFLGG